MASVAGGWVALVQSYIMNDKKQVTIISCLVTISLSSLGRAHRGERDPGCAGGGDRRLRSVQRLQLPHRGRGGQLRGKHHPAPPRLLEGGRHKDLLHRRRSVATVYSGRHWAKGSNKPMSNILRFNVEI